MAHAAGTIINIHLVDTDCCVKMLIIGMNWWSDWNKDIKYGIKFLQNVVT